MFADDEELPLNLSTKNRQIWSPGSACEREKSDAGAESPVSRWEDQDDLDAPLELVKRCPSIADTDRPLSAELQRCPSAPAHPTFPPPPPPVDLNFSLILKNENRNEKSFQVRNSIKSLTYFNFNIRISKTNTQTQIAAYTEEQDSLTIILT